MYNSLHRLWLVITSLGRLPQHSHRPCAIYVTGPGEKYFCSPLTTLADVLLCLQWRFTFFRPNVHGMCTREREQICILSCAARPCERVASVIHAASRNASINRSIQLSFTWWATRPAVHRLSTSFIQSNRRREVNRRKSQSTDNEDIR